MRVTGDLAEYMLSYDCAYNSKHEFQKIVKILVHPIFSIRLALENAMIAFNSIGDHNIYGMK